MKSNNEIFDSYAEIWNSYSFVQDNAKNFVKYIKEKIKLNIDTVIMDFGCGTGIVGLNLINNVKKVVFLDPSKGMIKQVQKAILKKNIHNYEILEGDINKYKGDKLDLILVANVFHHIEDINYIINKFFKYIKKRGKSFSS